MACKTLKPSVLLRLRIVRLNNDAHFISINFEYDDIKSDGITFGQVSKWFLLCSRMMSSHCCMKRTPKGEEYEEEGRRVRALLGVGE